MIEPSDPEGEWIELEAPARGSAFVTREGQRPSAGGAEKPARPVLCVHGAPGSGRDFRYLAPALVRAGFEVFRVDMPGFGKTPLSTWSDHGSRGRAGFLTLVARALKLDRPIFVGHSIGCPPVLVAAAWFPDRIRGAVLINTPGVERHRGIGIPEKATGALGKLLSVPGLGERILAGAKVRYRKAGFRDADVDAMDEATMRLHTEIVSGLDFHLLRGAARKLATPVLIASSGNDPLIEASVPHGLVDAMTTRVTHLHYADGGHYLQKHRAEEIAAETAVLFRS